MRSFRFFLGFFLPSFPSVPSESVCRFYLLSKVDGDFFSEFDGFLPLRKHRFSLPGVTGSCSFLLY
jgi:hypothetical protein